MFSENAIYENGTYTFHVSLNNIKTVNLDKVKIKCNMYNISENNNKFYLIEQNKKTLVTIPIGYYEIDFLLKVISECMNNVSINKNKDYFYKVYNDEIKNKVCFCCEVIDLERLTRPINFNLSFLHTKDEVALYDMLGFVKTDYLNNNFYIADKPSCLNLYDELYIKIFINKIELEKCNTSKKDFCYFESFDVDVSKYFGKTYIVELPNSQYYINNDVNMNTLSIKVYNSYDSCIRSPMWFKMNFTFEYT